MKHKIACTHCGQDWIKRYQRRDTGEFFHLCPECESVWLEGQNTSEETELYLSEFMGTGDPSKDWEKILCAE